MVWDMDCGVFVDGILLVVVKKVVEEKVVEGEEGLTLYSFGADSCSYSPHC
jgi:hypothetical protein